MSATDRAALYLRLSRDDAGSGESASIASQRRILTAYAQEHGFSVAQEYVDDGYSGTNFERPAFHRLLADIERGAINLVLTKDLSRLGRDYIQVGQYAEIYFPSKNVRYIAVNDGYDSASPYTDIAPFKNVVNELYARDTSRKIRSALDAKRKSGCYIGNFAPYGYRKDPQNKNQLLPDDEAAHVVQRIFHLAADGMRPSAIAALLSREGVLPPLLYRCARLPACDARISGMDWSAATVSKLLGNPTYLGHVVQGKTVKPSLKSKKPVPKPRDDWVIVENMHQPLITKSLFEQAALRRRARACPAKGSFSNLFSGLAFCADCGRGMSTVGTRKKDSAANLACGGYKQHGKAACSNHFIDYHALYTLVLNAVRTHVSLSEQEHAALLDALRPVLQTEVPPSHASVSVTLAQLDRIIERLYHDLAAGLISEDRFYRLLQTHEAQSAALRTQLDTCAGVKAQNAAQVAERRLSTLAARYLMPGTLDADLLFALISRIEIGQSYVAQTESGSVRRQAIRIVFRFALEEQTNEYFL